MIRRILPLLLLAGCAHEVDRSYIPQLDDLPDETKKPCPELPNVTGQLGDLAMKDTGAAIEYARCQARAATAVGAYEAARIMLQNAAKAASPEQK